jgi:hypothetical protein
MLSSTSYYYNQYCVASKNKPDFFRKSNPNKRWAEITLDIKEMRKLLLDSDFIARATLSQAITAAERKRDWFYRQEDFDLSVASFILRAAESVTV